MFKSVFAKYIVTFVLIIFISFAVLVSIMAGMVNSYAVTAKEQTLSNTAHNAADFLGARAERLSSSTRFDQIVLTSLADVDDMLTTYAAVGEDISILLVDNNGEVVLIDEIASGNMRVYKGSEIVEPVELTKLILNR